MFIEIMIISAIINLFAIDNMLLVALLKIVNLVISVAILSLFCEIILRTKLKKVIGKE